MSKDTSVPGLSGVPGVPGDSPVGSNSIRCSRVAHLARLAGWEASWRLAVIMAADSRQHPDR